MYVITGGAGFIGSNLVARLAGMGMQVVVVDWLREDERWRNLARHEIAELISPDALLPWLSRCPEPIEAVVHLGANSSTVETNVDLLVRTNIRSTLDLLQWCIETQTAFLYASSAATYGDGSAGFEDGLDGEALSRLRPLNAYAWSKHVIDRRIAHLSATGARLPPKYVGLKFFNVYGPNEYHKGPMRSVIAQNFARLRAGEPLRLFRSYREDYADGGQVRDFIYVRDCIEVIVWMLEQPRLCGLFNVGTGQARSWNDLASALFQALDQPRHIEYIDMPAPLRQKYQYATQANIERLRAAGYTSAFTSLEAGIADYVRNFLATPDPYA